MGAALLGAAPSAWAQGSGAIRVVSGATTDRINVPIDRAVVIETDRPVGELSIANPSIADVAVLGENNLYILGRATGRTTLTLVDDVGLLLANVDVQVAPDVTEFKERLEEILPGEPIEVRTANNGIVLSGTVSGARKITKALELAERYSPDAVTNLLSVGGSQQVMLEVRFAEVQRAVAKQLGSSLATSFADGNVGGTGGTRTLLQNDNLTNLFDNDPATGVTGAAGVAGGLLLNFAAGNVAVSALFEALETQGMVRTLAEPNLVAISGQEASFLAGGEYPIPVADGNGGITVDYREFGVELGFIPTVVDEDLINLKLATAVSALDTTVTLNIGGVTVNAFTVRRAETTIELRDGESFAIAGLIQDDFNDLKNAVPWLSDVPVLGTLFRSTQFSRDQSELVVIITPHLVSPVDGGLSLPTDRVQIPNERELFLFGQLEGGTAVDQIANQNFEGAFGYALE
ncbi:MAG: type II and III secretion system protein family protein [Pseudomonadota bacterium]